MDNGAFSVLGLFDSAQLLMNAIPVVRGKVKARLEAYTPYPIHGIEKALGLKKSPITGMVFVMGLIGAVAGLAFQMWTSGVDYPLITSGKPYFSWEAFVPIMFEMMVLFATFTAGLGMLFLLNRLPYFRHPMLRAKSMPLITRDKFALAVEADGGDLAVDAIVEVLRQAGAQTVEVVEQPAPPGPVSPKFLLRVIVAIGISCFVAGYLTYWGVKLLPISVPIVHMLEQPKLMAYREEVFFKDGIGMRPPVAGTVARGHLPYAIKDQNEAAILANPLARTEDVLKRGRQAFNTFCSVCHGILGNGATTLTAAYGAKPANLAAQQFREYPDGKIYHAITIGRNAMPGYSPELSEDERWAVVHYVRVLQRALNAKDEDLSQEMRK